MSGTPAQSQVLVMRHALKIEPLDKTQELSLMSAHAATPSTSDIPARRQQGVRLPRKPGPRRQQVSAYRFLMLFVFACVVLVDVWADLEMPAATIRVVGPLSVIVWALTLLGALKLGPLAVVKEALRGRW